MPIPQTTSAAFRQLNPQLFPGEDVALAGPAPRRIAQAQTELNKTELRAQAWLAGRGIHTTPHALTFRLANGCRYTPDLVHRDYETGKITCYEVKGPHMRDDSVVKLKVAADAWQGAIKFVLLWEHHVGGRWYSQVVG